MWGERVTPKSWLSSSKDEANFFQDRGWEMVRIQDGPVEQDSPGASHVKTSRGS